MNPLDRRSFIIKTIKISAAIALTNTTTKLFADEKMKKISSKNISVVISMPIQVVIDDVGWWSGQDGSKWQ